MSLRSESLDWPSVSLLPTFISWKIWDSSSFFDRIRESMTACFVEESVASSVPGLKQEMKGMKIREVLKTSIQSQRNDKTKKKN